MTNKNQRIVYIALSIIAFLGGKSFSKDEPSGFAELSGTVRDADNKPIADATVMIWTASEKVGYSIYCPGCYSDCGKRAKANERGEFSIPKLSRNLRFKILTIRDGYSTQFVDKVDPLSDPIQVTLQRRERTKDFSHVVRGRVVGSDGKPVREAVISPEKVSFVGANGQVVGMGGAVEGLDPIAVSNDEGEFEIAFAKSAIKMTLVAHARALAPARFADLKTGENRHTLTLHSGATVKGRLVHEGKPVSGAEMGLVTQSRRMGENFAEERIGTLRDGTFLFVNVPAGEQWYVYAKMESIWKQGATDAVKCATRWNGEVIELGDVEIKPGHRLSGQVRLTDGQEIPAGMRILMGTERAWDTQSAPLPADGRFEFTGIPTDDISITAGVKGYHASPKNPNLSWGIEGFIDRDLDDFVILLDPGQEGVAGRTTGKFRGKPLVSAIKAKWKISALLMSIVGVFLFICGGTSLLCFGRIPYFRNRWRNGNSVKLFGLLFMLFGLLLPFVAASR